MKAYVIEKAGGPENLILRDIPTPKASADKILIKIKAFGLNRSEYFTRMGDSPNVRFPRVLSIEGTGNVAESEDGEFSKRRQSICHNDIPTTVKLTAYSGDAGDIDSDIFNQYVKLVENGKLKIQLGKTFPFADLQEAHRLMDSNSSNGKIVVVL